MATSNQSLTSADRILSCDQPEGVAVDAAGNIYVADHPSKSVFVYAAGANGNVAPIRVISGSKTTLTYPWGIAVDGRNRIYVTNIATPKSVSIFAADANGDVGTDTAA